MDLPACICSLCKKPFIIPRRFPCLHTFCERCIQKHIDNTICSSDDDQQESLQGVPCPTCEKFAKKPEDVTASTWALSFPLNRFMLMTIHEHCNACSNEFSLAKATSMCPFCEIFLCFDCKEAHDQCYSGHTLIRLKSFDGKNNAMLCHEHERPFYSFCHDHSVRCCDDCITEAHADCKKITALDSINRDVEKRLMSLQEQAKGIYRKNRKERKYFQRMIISSKEKVTTMRTVINSALDQLENSLFQEIDEAHREECRRIDEMKSKTKDLELTIECLKMAATGEVDLHTAALLSREREISSWIEQHCDVNILQKPRVDIDEKIPEFILAQTALGYFTPLKRNSKPCVEEQVPDARSEGMIKDWKVFLDLPERDWICGDDDVSVDCMSNNLFPQCRTQEDVEYGQEEADANHTERRIQYSRSFLLQFQSHTLSLTKPTSLPDIPEITLDQARFFFQPSFMHQTRPGMNAPRSQLGMMNPGMPNMYGMQPPNMRGQQFPLQHSSLHFGIEARSHLYPQLALGLTLMNPNNNVRQPLCDQQSMSQYSWGPTEGLSTPPRNADSDGDSEGLTVTLSDKHGASSGGS